MQIVFNGKEYLVESEALRSFMRLALEKAGFHAHHAADAADVLHYASRRGIDTHGIKNLKGLYINRLAGGYINPDPHFKIEYETALSARVDGDRGLGLAAACWAMRIALDKAKIAGIGLVSMRNSRHFGAAGYYPWMALSHDMIGIGMTGRFSPTGQGVGVRPTFGAIPMFSTNPLAISFPTEQEPPYIFDMATSTVPFNRIIKLRDAGQSIPLGWGVDTNGMPTTNPGDVRSLFPLGGTYEQGSHKGYGLSMMVEVLCGVLSGSWAEMVEAESHRDTENRPETMDPEVDQMGSFEGFGQQGDAHFFGAIRIDMFRPASDFKQGMDAMIRALHAAPKEPGQERIYVAGEIEHETELTRLGNGIPVADTVVAEMEELSGRYDLPLEVVHYP